jgi:very-short-patch-repair endonuclease
VDPLTALAYLGGAARWDELQAQAVRRRDLVVAVRQGQVTQLGRGAYCLAGSERAEMSLAVQHKAVLSCGSAARHHGLEVFGATTLHLTAPSERRAAPSGLVVHRRASERDARATRLEQTLRDCGRCLPLCQAVSVLDSALRLGRVDQHDLAALVPGRGRDAGRLAEAVRLVDPQAQSVLESAARVLFVTNGLGPLRSQVRVERVGWVDFVLSDWLVVEVDGYAVHRDRFDEDRRRDAELVRQGYVVLRFTYRDIERRPQWVLDVVRETLRRGRSHRRALDR